MYLRLQARHNSFRTGKPCGIFHILHQLERKAALNEQEKKLFHEIDAWFDENLPNPPYYDDGNTIKAITWFKEVKVVHMLERLGPLVEIAERHGVCVDTVRCAAPGEIVYEDDWQVGAL